MSSEHFILTISQNNADHTDFAIHLKDRKKNKEHFLMHLNFAESVMVNESFMDDIVVLVARCLAKRLLNDTLNSDSVNLEKSEEMAKQVVADALEKMRRV